MVVANTAIPSRKRKNSIHVCNMCRVGLQWGWSWLKSHALKIEDLLNTNKWLVWEISIHLFGRKTIVQP